MERNGRELCKCLACRTVPECKTSASRTNLGVVSTNASYDEIVVPDALASPSNVSVPDHIPTVYNTMRLALLTNQQPEFTHMFNAHWDWHVGVGLWKAMGDELHKKCDELCHQH